MTLPGLHGSWAPYSTRSRTHTRESAYASNPFAHSPPPPPPPPPHSSFSPPDLRGTWSRCRPSILGGANVDGLTPPPSPLRQSLVRRDPGEPQRPSSPQQSSALPFAPPPPSRPGSCSPIKIKTEDKPPDQASPSALYLLTGRTYWSTMECRPRWTTAVMRKHSGDCAFFLLLGSLRSYIAARLRRQAPIK